MSALFFAALVAGDQASGYNATIPDLPGVSAAAQDLACLLGELRRHAVAHLQALAEAGEPWPSPTPIEAVSAPAGVLALLVDVPVDDAPVRVNISLGERLLQRLDAAAHAGGMTRSGFIAQAVRMSLGEQPRAGVEFEAIGRRMQDELAALGRRINDSIGPESVFSRRMAEFDDRIFDGVRRAADNVSAAVARRQQAQRATGARPASDLPRDGAG
jgi:predicted RNase H-like HicB family nuclease